MVLNAAIVGASGYVGGEVARILGAHPEISVGSLIAHSQAGAPVTSVHPHLARLADRHFAPLGPETLAGADLIFVCLPHGQSAAIDDLLPAAARVVDLGADHRLTDAATWEAFYGGSMAEPWIYGLPELADQRDRIAAATRVAAAGCFVTAATLALAPLLATHLIEPSISIVAASGTSGAGRGAKPHLLGSEVMGDLTPYKIGGTHQHTPEIEQNLTLAAQETVMVSFTPILAPMPRGILLTATANFLGTEDEARAAFEFACAGEPFVRLLSPNVMPRTKAVAGTNRADLQVAVDGRAGRVVVVAAIDNLGKGAAGQAVQCANLMCGLEETAGLTIDGVAP